MLNRQVLYKIFVLALGALPASFCFLTGTYMSFFLFNNIADYFFWAISYGATLMGALGFWIEFFLKNKAPKYRIFVLIMMVLGIIFTVSICFAEPEVFEHFTLLVLSVITVASVVIYTNLHKSQCTRRARGWSVMP